MAAKKWVFGGYDLVFACGVMRMTFARAGDQALCELLTNSHEAIAEAVGGCLALAAGNAAACGTWGRVLLGLVIPPVEIDMAPFLLCFGSFRALQPFTDTYLSYLGFFLPSVLPR